MKEKHWLIVYDIRDTKRLAKVARCVESFACRIQKSVFETYATEETIMHLKHSLEQILQEDEDFVLFFEVCESDWQKREIYAKISTNNNRTNMNEEFLIL